MKYIKKRRACNNFNSNNEEDPLNGVANLFDAGVVFIAALLVVLMSVHGYMELFADSSEFTLIKKNKNGEMEIITKKGKEIKVQKVSNKKSGGEKAKRLGVAYQLKDGRSIYVPE